MKFQHDLDFFVVKTATFPFSLYKQSVEELHVDIFKVEYDIHCDHQ
jgi:hypothetical protein